MHNLSKGTTQGPHNDVTARIVLASLNPERRLEQQLLEQQLATVASKLHMNNAVNGLRQPVGGGRWRKNWLALTWQARPFCSGKEQLSFLLLCVSLRRYGKIVHVHKKLEILVATIQ